MTTQIDRDLLRVIRHKLVEKRRIAKSGTTFGEIMGTHTGTIRATAFGEAIELIDEALVVLEGGDDE